MFVSFVQFNSFCNILGAAGRNEEAAEEIRKEIQEQGYGFKGHLKGI